MPLFQMNHHPKYALETCPYDPHHRCRADRMTYHIVKCQAKSSQLKGICPYNANHRFPEPDRQSHLMTCPDKSLLDGGGGGGGGCSRSQRSDFQYSEPNAQKSPQDMTSAFATDWRPIEPLRKHGGDESGSSNTSPVSQESTNGPSTSSSQPSLSGDLEPLRKPKMVDGFPAGMPKHALKPLRRPKNVPE